MNTILDANMRDAAARARHATPGPLRVVPDMLHEGLFVLTTARGVFVGGGLSAVDAEFFARARADIQAAHGEIERLTAENTATALGVES